MAEDLFLINSEVNACCGFLIGWLVQITLWKISLCLVVLLLGVGSWVLLRFLESGFLHLLNCTFNIQYEIYDVLALVYSTWCFFSLSVLLVFIEKIEILL